MYNTKLHTVPPLSTLQIIRQMKGSDWSVSLYLRMSDLEGEWDRTNNLDVAAYSSCKQLQLCIAQLCIYALLLHETSELMKGGSWNLGAHGRGPNVMMPYTLYEYSYALPYQQYFLPPLSGSFLPNIYHSFLKKDSLQYTAGSASSLTHTKRRVKIDLHAEPSFAVTVYFKSRTGLSSNQLFFLTMTIVTHKLIFNAGNLDRFSPNFKSMYLKI